MTESMVTRSLKPDRRLVPQERRRTATPRPDPIELLLGQMLGIEQSQQEEPQAALARGLSLLLPHLQPEAALGLLSRFSAQLQALVATRLALIERTDDKLVAEATYRLEQKLSWLAQGSRGSGPELLSRVLSNAGHETREAVLEVLDEVDSDLATEIRESTFAFEDLPRLDNRSIQRLLREIKPDDLATALDRASDEIRECVFRNQSVRAARVLQDEMALSRPAAPQVIQSARERIASVARRLKESGQISMT